MIRMDVTADRHVGSVAGEVGTRPEQLHLIGIVVDPILQAFGIRPPGWG